MANQMATMQGCCCEPTVIECVNSNKGCILNGGKLPSAVIVTLPPAVTTAAGRFTTGGGDFLCDLYRAIGHPDGTELFYHAESEGTWYECSLFGPIIGTECGDPVRPYASFVLRPFFEGIKYIGYARCVVGGKATRLYHVIIDQTASGVVYPLPDCLDFDMGLLYGPINTAVTDCSGGPIVSRNYPVTFNRLRTA